MPASHPTHYMDIITTPLGSGERPAVERLLRTVPARDGLIDCIPLVFVFDDLSIASDQRIARGSVCHDYKAISFRAICPQFGPETISASIVL